MNCILDVVHRNRNLDIYLKLDKKHNSDSKIKEEINLFLDGKESLSMSSKVIILEMFNLVVTYSLDELLNKKESVKKELKTGIYDFIKMPNPKLTQKEREMLGNISDIWNCDDIVNYTNLPLLEKRYFDILNNNKIKELDIVRQNISIIQEMIKNGVPKNEISVDLVNDFKIKMDKVYSDFELLNKEDIINFVYFPKHNIDFSNKEENNVLDTMLVHFYSPDSMMEDIFNIVAINRQRICNSEEPIRLKSLRDIFCDSSIKEQIKNDKLRLNAYINKQEIKDSVDELQPNKSFKVYDSDVGIPRKDVLEVASNQLACYLINKESLINLLNRNDNIMKVGDGNIAFAVGFSKTTVSPKNILVSCDMNANSNLGVDNIPYEDLFTDLSKTYLEISEVKNRRTEVLLKRDGIKAAYLMILKKKILQNMKKNL